MMSSQGLNEKFAALSQREKIMALCAGVVLIMLVGLTYVVEPVMKASSAASKGVTQERARQVSLIKQIDVYAQALKSDPDAELNAKLTQLQQKKIKLQTRFADQLDELVLPWEMPAIIDTVFASASNLTLQEMVSLAPTNLMADTPSMEGVALYQHGVSLTFSGRYFDVRDFLASLESADGQLYWQQLEYDVGDYPTASVVLTVYTLSTNKAFIGVE